MELRQLKSSDIFPMIQILNKIGFKELKTVLTPDRLKSMVSTFKAKQEEEEDDDDTVDQTTVLGFNLVFEVAGIIMQNLPSCEQDLYKFLSGVSGLSVQEITDLPMSDFAEMIVDVIQKPEFKDFFKAVSKLFK